MTKVQENVEDHQMLTVTPKHKEETTYNLCSLKASQEAFAKVWANVKEENMPVEQLQ